MLFNENYRQQNGGGVQTLIRHPVAVGMGKAPPASVPVGQHELHSFASAKSTTTSTFDPSDVYAYQKHNDDHAAVCSIWRSGSIRKEAYLFSTGSKAGWYV